MTKTIRVSHNEPGSISVRELANGHISFKIFKQSRNGDIEGIFEVSLEPNSALHIVSENEPQPEEAP